MYNIKMHFAMMIIIISFTILLQLKTEKNGWLGHRQILKKKYYMNYLMTNTN